METGWYNGTPVEQHICPSCGVDEGVIENELHVLLHCPKHLVI
jgi:hypothetical protein